MAAVPRFCGRCGSPLAPGALFCGRCGAPQQVAAAMAAPAPYVYRAAPPGAFQGTRSPRLSQIMVAGGLLVILSVATVAISAFAVSHVIGGTHATCTANCSPKIVTPLPEASTYRSTAFKYEVDYNSQWTVRSSDAGGISLGTKIGTLDVTGTKSSTDLPALIQAAVTALPSATWQNVTRVADLKGAHLGDQNGLGAVYSANLVGSNATATKVMFAVIAATRGGISVVLVAVNPADLKNFPNGMPEGQEFDYLCQEFRWA
jgi:zinc ribbon protein